MTNRRTFLTGAGLLAAAAPLPGFLARAFAQDACCDERERAAIVASGYRRARSVGRPLLVLVVPPDTATDSYERAHAFGEWLNHGSDESLALLALVEVVAARLGDLRAVVPGIAAEGARTPLMILIDTAASPPTHRVLDAELPSFVGASGGIDEAAIDRRIVALGDMLERALVPDAAQLALLVGRTDPRSPVRAAPAYQRAMAAQGAERARILRELAESARARFVRERIPGSRWAVSFGCGTEIEGDPNPMAVDCGMGHVPARSARFLHFYTDGGS
jgi:hypothetical protein